MGRTGLLTFRPLRCDHPEIGHRCLLCKRPIQSGDEIGHVPRNADDRESATLVVAGSKILSENSAAQALLHMDARSILANSDASPLIGLNREASVISSGGIALQSM